MLKYTLTIESDNPDELTAYLAVKHPEVTNIVAMPSPTPTQATTQVAVGEPADTDDDGPTNATPPELDARGYPWDERIHASSKVINKDGTWRYRRNTAQDVIDAVEAEIKPNKIEEIQVAPETAPTVPTPMPNGSDGMSHDMAHNVTPAPTPLETAIEATPVPAPIPVPGATPEPHPLDIPPHLQRTAVVTYEQAIAQISDALNDASHPLTPERVAELYTKLGVSGPHELPGNQPALDAVKMMLDTMQ